MENGTVYTAFAELSKVDVSKYIEKKNGLNYLSWANAWAELLKRYPESSYRVIGDPEGLNYHTDGRTCWVEVGVTVNGIERIETLPVMDFRNASIPRDKVTSYDVNKAIKRCMVKAIGLHGLGLYIYAGEDLPEDAEPPKPVEKEIASFVCTECSEVIKPVIYKDEEFPVRRIAHISSETYGRPLCWKCMGKLKKAKEDEANAE